MTKLNQHRVEKENDVVPSSKLRIEYVLISQLKKNPHNARSHSPGQIAKLKASIKNFTFLVEATFAECEARAKRGEPPSELTVDLSCPHAPEARS